MVFKRLVIVVAFCILNTFAHAQPPPAPATQPQNPQGDPDNPVPITGIEYLILAGSAYGVYRYSNRKNKPTEEA